MSDPAVSPIAERSSSNTQNPDSQITVRLPDGSERTLGVGATATDLAENIGKRLAKDALIAIVDGVEQDLDVPLADAQQVAIITPDSPVGRHTIRHSTAHVLAQAVLELYPGATFAIGPPITDGFYYDFELPGKATFSDDDLAEIDAKMREIIKARQPFVRTEASPTEALELMAEHPYKRQIIEAVSGAGNTSADDELATEASGDVISFYRNTDAFVDMCVGPHVPHTGHLGYFKLMSVAGAYWRGSEKNPMLQRIYGTAWESNKALAAHLERLEQAALRDHRKLATELDLLSFPSELGGGLAVWHPKGAVVRKLMEDYSRARHASGGYEFAYTPHLANARLFEISGHLDFYADSMYPPMEMDNGKYYPKPMNCPMHNLVYKSRQRSYRELPLRLYELGTVYRYELSGALHGLLRIRGFTQDDSHIYCTEEQANGEIRSLLEFVLSVLRAFGFEEFEAMLSTRPAEKSVGTDDGWNEAIEHLRAALVAEDIPYEVDEGGGAFYGPKIDIKVRDAIGRAWQLSTIQYDFNLPERFELEYIGDDGAAHRPIMLHRALFGSVERFFGVLVEHFAGAFPVWLSPVQVQVLPVSDDHVGYANELNERFTALGLRSEVVVGDQLGKRIRNGKTQKVPYVLVVGADDVAANTAGVNPRGGNVDRDVPIDDFVARIRADIESHA